MSEFRLPDLGEGLTEAEIVAWHVAVGDEVRVDQVVVDVETAKASVEVPIPYAGTVSQLHAKVGEVVAVGAPLISVGAAASNGTDAESSEYSGNVLIGYGTSAGRSRRARRGSSPTPLLASLQRQDRPGAKSGRTVAVVSPLVRRMAREADLDLSSVRGSGPGGLIMRRDVEGALARPADEPDVQRIPLQGVRKAMADKLSRSRREIPEATVWVDVDATDLLTARAAINARRPEEPVSLLALLARFVVAGLSRYPELNGRIVGEELVLPRAVGLGFAAQTERGLVVPVVANAQQLSVRQLSGELARMTGKARDGKLTPADTTGGTITVNNYGVFGVDGSAAIINHPEVAIVGIGRIVDRPWVVDGALAVRKITQLTLSFDHRACDGGTAGGFLRYVADCVESPISLLADL
ncbi:MAG TPA: dihydrolipoamide acetyltransferase family protein [Jatrophihabitans sp.]|jgi:pyruvate dehydrogenase E2 component (dihydrolipoamide acetyltransferase)